VGFIKGVVLGRAEVEARESPTQPEHSLVQDQRGRQIDLDRLDDAEVVQGVVSKARRMFVSVLVTV
jgi:hypothetical protein